MAFPERLDIPTDVLDISNTLEGAGFEAWCVGGAIRDTLLGEANSDFDIATSATPEQVRALFPHNVPVGEKYGTIAVRSRRRFHEVTTFRQDVRTDGRHAEVQFGVSLEEDLARRDFTINAIAYHPIRQEWRDPFDGAADLDQRTVRAVGEAGRRFGEDYLRILRALRFAARFEFKIDTPTWDAALAAAPGLVNLSAERVRDEWFKGLRTTRSIERLVDLWWKVGAAKVWLPELVQEPRPQLPAAPAGAVRAPERRQSLVGRREERSAALPELTGVHGATLRRDPVLLTILLCLDPVAVLVRLKASNAEIARAAAVLAGRPEPEGATPVAVRRWLSAVGDAADDLEMLWELRHRVAPIWEPVMRGIRERGEPLTRKELAITGADLQSAGVPPGPAMGNLLERLLAMVVDDPALNTREVLLARARSLR